MTARALLHPSRELLSIVWDDGTAADFAAAWLFDNAPAAREGLRGQRLSTARALRAAGSILAASVDGSTLRLAYAASECLWPLATLHTLARDDTSHRPVIDGTLWRDGAAIAARAPHGYKAYAADEAALGRALAEVEAFGLTRLASAGAAEDELERVVARFGYIRETNYGRLFAVRAAAATDNLAYTARALEPHTDNPYRDPPPSLQLLHGIPGAAGGGGETFFLDGFALAEDLRRWDPDAFAQMTTVAVPFSFTASDGRRFAARSPIIRLDTDGLVTGIRFNHRSLGVIDQGAEQAAVWYAAYGVFAEMAASRARRFAVRLEPGDVVIFDNARLLHGREAFSGAGGRLLMGCYADRDGLLATLAKLRGHAAQA